MQGSSRDEDRVSQKLDDGAALYAVLLKQTLPLLTAKVPARLPDRVVLWQDLRTLLLRDLQTTKKHDTRSDTAGPVRIWYLRVSSDPITSGDLTRIAIYTCTGIPLLCSGFIRVVSTGVAHMFFISPRVRLYSGGNIQRVLVYRCLWTVFAKCFISVF